MRKPSGGSERSSYGESHRGNFSPRGELLSALAQSRDLGGRLPGVGGGVTLPRRSWLPWGQSSPLQAALVEAADVAVSAEARQLAVFRFLGHFRNEHACDVVAHLFELGVSFVASILCE